MNSYTLNALKITNTVSLNALFPKETFHKFFNTHINVTACNFRCKYCYVGHKRDQDKGTLPKFSYPPEFVAEALNQKRLGGVCLFNLCGAGETLLPPEMPAYIKAILGQGHFVSIVSNMSLSKRIAEVLSAPPEHLERVFFKCSLHWHELQRLNMLDVFCENIEKVRRAGCSITIEITPYDDLIPDIDAIKTFSMQHFGALPHITIARDEVQHRNGLPRYTRIPLDEYKRIWGSFGSELFQFKNTIFGRKIREFCYAGSRHYDYNLATGKLSQCHFGGTVSNMYQDITQPLRTLPVACKCPEPHCYNGHAYIAFGCVPALDAPTYAELRDRVCTDGSHWLSPRMAAFFAQKLSENHAHCSSRWLFNIP